MKHWALLCLVLFSLVALNGAQVTNPSICEQWLSGVTYDITYALPNATNVNIYLYKVANTQSPMTTIATGQANTGSFLWEVPFYQYTEYSFGNCDLFIQIDDAAGTVPSITSTDFFIANPVTWGTPNLNCYYDHAADTLIKLRWSGLEVSTYFIQYRVQGSATIRNITHDSDRLEGEVLDEEVIFNLQPNSKYEYRISYAPPSGVPSQSAWTDWVETSTYPTLDCSNDVLAAWFAFEVYDNIREGERKYPGFCGDFETAFALNDDPNWNAIYYDANSKRMFLSYRGTVASDTEDVNSIVGALDDCSKYFTTNSTTCQVHSGFATSYVNSAKTEMINFVSQAINDSLITSLIHTGHSQGGSISTISFLDYYAQFNTKIVNSLINFGCTEVGNQDFSDLLASTNSITLYYQQDEVGVYDFAREYPSVANGTLPPQFTTGFVNTTSSPTAIPCSNDTYCRSQGTGLNPPYYCHCACGYWEGMAVEFAAPPSPSPSPVASPTNGGGGGGGGGGGSGGVTPSSDVQRASKTPITNPQSRTPGVSTAKNGPSPNNFYLIYSGASVALPTIFVSIFVTLVVLLF